MHVSPVDFTGQRPPRSHPRRSTTPFPASIGQYRHLAKCCATCSWYRRSHLAIGRLQVQRTDYGITVIP